jgi:hypothetical protein
MVVCHICYAAQPAECVHAQVTDTVSDSQVSQLYVKAFLLHSTSLHSGGLLWLMLYLTAVLIHLTLCL